MAATRITFNTDSLGLVNDSLVRKEIARRLPELAELLAEGKYVGRFALGAPWKVWDVKAEHSPAGGFSTQDKAIQWVNDNVGENWTSDDYTFVASGKVLTGDVDEL